MKAHATAGFVLAILVGISPAGEGPASQPATRASGEFTVATYNINYGNPDLKGVVETIRESQADLVCIQETNNASARYFRRRLRRLYPHIKFHPPRAGGRKSRPALAAGGFGFLSKVPVKNLRYIPRKHGWFGFWICEVVLGGKTVQVVNVHLQAVVPMRKEGLWGLTKLFLKTEGIRAAQIARICEHLSAEKPVIVAGDLNSVSQLSAPAHLKRRGLVDSFASVTDDPDKNITWHWNYRGIEWRSRIDYIFHTPDIRTIRSSILDRQASDHYLLVSTLEWAPRNAPTTRPTTTSAPAAVYKSSDEMPRTEGQPQK